MVNFIKENIINSDMMNTTSIPSDVASQVEEIIDTFGFKNQEEFVQEAIRDKVLELKKKLFIMGSDKIAAGLQQKGITEKDLFSDFMKKSHSA